MNVKIGLTKAGIGPIDDVLFIQKAAEYGFEAVDLDAKQLVDKNGLERAQQLLKDHGMIIGSIGLDVEWRGTDEQFKQGLEGLTLSAACAEQLGCKACTTYILPSTDEKAASFMARSISRLRLCAEVLGAYGIRLGLEFVGPHHLRTAWKHPFIWTAEETLEMIDAMGMSNVGLLVDFYHCHTTGLTPNDLLRLKENQIVHVHINDAYDLPVEQLLDNDRAYPGEGVIDLSGYLNSLALIGYHGVVSQEVLSPAQPEGTWDDLLARSQSGFGKVFK
ncbi:Sugar phosphate isomerase/epimerase [Paenibacillus sp. 453mf]|nr:Sugar phosphate isomerase/epimerase [Paenibacillus sp. 453mf]